MSNNNILVTGGAGYIGSHACKALADAGYTPVAYDNLSRGHGRLVKWGPFEPGDIGDAARLGEVIAKYSPFAVMHFAAYAYVGESTQAPLRYYRNNVAGALTLLEAMQHGGVTKLIFSSSCATYGIPDAIPIAEDQPQMPINPYGRTKLMCEQMIKDFAAAGGLDYMILRYFNAAGADPEGATGEYHNPETHLVPLLIRAALTGEPFYCFGDDYPTADGTCVRDFIHVSDLADAHVAALTALAAGKGSHALNLGCGCGVSIRQAREIVEKAVGKKVAMRINPRRQGDPPALVADASRAKNVLGWQCKRSDFEIIVSDAAKTQKA